MAPTRSKKTASWGLAQTQRLLALLANSEDDMMPQRAQDVEQACSFLKQADAHCLMAADLLLEHLCQCLSKAFTSLARQLVAGSVDTSKQSIATCMHNLNETLSVWITSYTDLQNLSAVEAGRIASTGRCSNDAAIRVLMHRLLCAGSAEQLIRTCTAHMLPVAEGYMCIRLRQWICNIKRVLRCH